MEDRYDTYFNLVVTPLEFDILLDRRQSLSMKDELRLLDVLIPALETSLTMWICRGWRKAIIASLSS